MTLYNDTARVVNELRFCIFTTLENENMTFITYLFKTFFDFHCNTIRPPPKYLAINGLERRS